MILIRVTVITWLVFMISCYRIYQLAKEDEREENENDFSYYVQAHRFLGFVANFSFCRIPVLTIASAIWLLLNDLISLISWIS